MTEHGHPGLEPGQPFEVGGDLVGDAAESIESESVGGKFHLFRRLDPFGDHDHRVFASLPVATLDYLGHSFEVDRDLRDENGVGTRGNPGVDGDPSLGATHYLAQDHAVVRLGRRGQTINGLRGDLHRGVESEREVGSSDVVVDRLGHADNSDPVVRQLECCSECAVSSDHHEGVDTVLVEGLANGLGPIAMHIRVAA